MWSGFDPEFVRQLGAIRKMVALRYQSPTHEWPVIVLDDQGEVLVVREWPDGSLTAYLASSRGSDAPANGA